MRWRKAVFPAIFLLFFVCPPKAFSDIIVLKTGLKREGKIVEKTESYVRLEVVDGIFVTYFLDEIAEIQETKEAGGTPPGETAPEVEVSLDESAEDFSNASPAKKEILDNLLAFFRHRFDPDNKNKLRGNVTADFQCTAITGATFNLEEYAAYVTKAFSGWRLLAIESFAILKEDVAQDAGSLDVTFLQHVRMPNGTTKETSPRWSLEVKNGPDGWKISRLERGKGKQGRGAGGQSQGSRLKKKQNKRIKSKGIDSAAD